MRRVGREGRAIVKSFSYPKSKDDLIEEVDQLARKEGLTFSDVVLQGIERFWKEHGKSQNPQTEITLFETGLENAMPNLYKIIEHPELLDKFYSLMKSQEEYRHLDEAINILNNKHNKKLSDFN